MNLKARIQIKREEWSGVILSFIYYFCVLAAYYVMRPMRDQLAAKVGSSQLPWFFSATLVATLLLTPLFAWLVSRWPRRVIMPIVYLFFIVCHFAFILFFIHHEWLSSRTIGLLFFVWVSVFNLFVVSVFWSFMTDIWSDSQARRLFPLIALGGTAGAVAGPFITRSLVEVIPLPSLLLISVTLLFVAILCIVSLGNWADEFGVHRNQTGSESPIGGGMLDGLKQIFSNTFIGSMAVLMLMNDAIGTIAYALVTNYSNVTFHDNAIAQTRFAANMDLASNTIQVFLQLTLTPWLLVRYGAGTVFATCAGIVVLSSLAMAFSNEPYQPLIGTMPILALVLILTRSLTHGMLQPARETLYTQVPRALRYKGKNAVDTVVWRAGDVLSLLLVNGLRTLGMSIGGFGILWAALAATAGMIGVKLANRTESGEYQKF